MLTAKQKGTFCKKFSHLPSSCSQVFNQNFLQMN